MVTQVPELFLIWQRAITRPGNQDLARSNELDQTTPALPMFAAFFPDLNVAMGQNPVPPVSIPIPTKIGPTMGGAFTYPKMGSHWF